MRALRSIPTWTIDATDGAAPFALDSRVVTLLRAIAERGSLAGAAREAQLPYRTAWALLAGATRILAAPLANLAPGRGAKLTTLGAALLAADERARTLMAAQAITVGLPRLLDEVRATGAMPLPVAASHDIALAQLRDGWRTAHAVTLEFHGSSESLASYVAETAEVAGFHVSLAPRERADPLLASLEPARDAVVRFLTRTQGLILPRGNPQRVASLADAAAKRLGFINRQPGSGTRLLLDRLLARAGIDPLRLPGYTNEEFTHAAVAATVAAGKAEVGFGIEAAAAHFDLAFVPLARERYLFAVRRRALDTPRIQAFRALLASPVTCAVVRSLPGYALDTPGALLARLPARR